MCICTPSKRTPWCDSCPPYMKNPLLHQFKPVVDYDTAKNIIMDAAFAYSKAKAAVELAELNLENARQALLKITTKPTA